MSRDSDRPVFLLLTCEHGGRDVPAEYRRVFRGAKAVLDGHRGFDLGALGVAHRMAARLAAPIVFSTVTRLLVELNRSLGHPELFSEFTRDLPEPARDRIVAAHYAPYRANVARIVTTAIGGGHRVVHLGIHSFTSRLGDDHRDFDLGLLFDPDRSSEGELCAGWRAELHRAGVTSCRFNQPYLGTDDGLTTSLRAVHPAEVYAGIEVEIRQETIGRRSEQRSVGDLLVATLRATGVIATESPSGSAHAG